MTVTKPPPNPAAPAEARAPRRIGGRPAGAGRRTTGLILPAEEEGWEVWECPARGAATRLGGVAHPVDWSGGFSQCVVGLPATRCLTLTFDFPVPADAAMARRMVFGQLEKRGFLPRGTTPESAPFACHPVEGGPDGGTRLGVDVLTDELPPSDRAAGARCFVSAFRLFPLPDDRLILTCEQGCWVVAAARGGALVFTQVLGESSRPVATLVADLRATALTLESRGLLLGSVSGIEMWGDHPAEAAERLANQLGIPVERTPRPSPDGAAALRLVRHPHLLPETYLAHRRRRRGHLVNTMLAAAVVAALLAVVGLFRHRLGQLENRAVAMEHELENSSDAASAVAQAGERWRELRNVLEPKRYPLVHLAHLTRLMPDQGIVMTGFDSKVSEIRFTGTAADAKTAYAYFNAIRNDSDLGVYRWSMDRPTLDDDGTATFEIKGKAQ